MTSRYELPKNKPPQRTTTGARLVDVKETDPVEELGIARDALKDAYMDGMRAVNEDWAAEVAAAEQRRQAREQGLFADYISQLDRLRSEHDKRR